MRKKIILGIVILAVIVGAVYFNMNYAVVEEYYYEYEYDPPKHIVRTDTEKIDKIVNCTPSLKKYANLKSLSIAVDKETNLEYLSQMNSLEHISLFYFDGYCGKLETLPELPNLRKLSLFGSLKTYDTFTISTENKYIFSNIEYLDLRVFNDIDFNSLNYFENLHTLYTCNINNDLTEEQIKELQSKGINVEIK